jgi:hypothetical protein
MKKSLPFVASWISWPEYAEKQKRPKQGGKDYNFNREQDSFGLVHGVTLPASPTAP